MSENKHHNSKEISSEPVDLGPEALLRGVSSTEKKVEEPVEAVPVIPEPSVAEGFTKPVLEEPILEINPQNAIVGEGKSKSLNRTILISALLALSVTVYFFSTLYFASDPEIAALPIDVPEVKVALMLPELSPVSSVTNLGALFYDVQKNFDIVPVPTPAQNAVTQTPKEPAKKSGKEVVNTAGPIEPAAVRERLSGRTPINEPKELRIRPSLPSNETPIDSGWYRVTGAGEIISEPGQVGRILGKLSRGDEVFVEARFGSWIRLKSKSGRTGYVPIEIVDSMPIERARR